MARRATYLKQHRSSREHSLVLDSGDIVGGMGEKEQLKARYIFKALSKINYFAINPGERDFLHGVKFLTDVEKEFNLPLISANIFQPGGKKLLFKPFIIKKLKGFQYGDINVPSIRVGVFGVVMYRSRLILDNSEPQLIVGDPIENAKKVVAEMKDRCDLIIGLVHVPYNLLTSFVQQVPGIDVIIAGHDPVFRMQAQKIENTIVIVGGNRGQYVGDLRLVLNGQKKIIDYEGNVVPLEKNIKDDPEILKLINEYKKEEAAIAYKMNRERNRAMKMYVGAESCKKCHEKQYKQWKKTAHARAFSRLQKEGKANDPGCVQCHTTGFSQYNGFYNFKETPGMIDVQCEVCHGIGKLHVQSAERIKSSKLKATILAPITEETCTACHNKTEDPEFNYEKDLKVVRH